MIYELSLSSDTMIIPYLNKGINLTSNNRHKHEKKDDNIRNLTRNEEAVSLKIAKISNPPL